MKLGVTKDLPSCNSKRKHFNSCVKDITTNSLKILRGQLCLNLKIESLLFVQFYLVIALATINWPAFTRFKGNLSFLATLGTGSREHFPWPRARIPLQLSCLTAGLTTFRFVGKALGCIKFLLCCCECEGGATISTFE